MASTLSDSLVDVEEKYNELDNAHIEQRQKRTTVENTADLLEKRRKELANLM